MKYNIVDEAVNGIIKSINVKFNILDIPFTSVILDVIIDINIDSGDFATIKTILINGRVSEKLEYIDHDSSVSETILKIVNKTFEGGDIK
ncbi:MAG: hypothetical protein R3Y05_01105 [bacterium]